MKKTLIKIVGFVFFWAVLLLGTVGQNPGAANVSTFLIWLGTLVSFSYLSDKTIAKIDKNDWLPPLITIPSDIAKLILLTWFGWFWTAGMFVLGFILKSYAQEEWKRQHGELA